MAQHDAEKVGRPRERYRFVGGGKVLTWQRHVPGDSRVEQITCSAEWFYGQMLSLPPEKGES